MSGGLTKAGIRDRIVKRTGLPRSVVAYVLDTLLLELKLELLSQGEVHLRGLLRIYTIQKTVTLPGKVPVVRIFLQVRPVRAFRAALNSVLPSPTQTG